MPAAVAIPLAFAVGGASLGASIYQGQSAAKAQRRALRSQEQAQREATSRAAAIQRRNEMESRRVNRRTPDIGRLLDTAGTRSRQGPGSTFLTGPRGVPASGMLLGGTSLLGTA